MSLRDNTPADDRWMALTWVGSDYLASGLKIDKVIEKLDSVMGPIEHFEKESLVNYLMKED